jgi:hypothetical protein
VKEEHDSLLLRSTECVSVFDEASGRILASQRIPNSLFHRNRYARIGGRIHTIAWDGENLRIDPISHIRWQRPVEDILAVFDREKKDGPFIITRAGEILCVADENPVPIAQLGALLHIHGISKDGNRLSAFRAISKPDDSKITFFDLNATRQTSHSNLVHETQFLSSNLARFSRQVDLHKYWSGVTVSPEGELQLLARKNSVWQITYGEYNRFILERVTPVKCGPFSPFRSIDSLLRQAAGVALQVAQLNKYSRVFLDSRGLLHLKSDDASIPETTLALTHERPLAGWCSDGAVCGDKFFFAHEMVSNPVAVFENVQRFTRSVL